MKKVPAEHWISHFKSKGRTFSLWQDEALRAVFAGLEFRVLDFQRDESRLGTGEVWLGYVLGREEAS